MISSLESKTNTIQKEMGKIKITSSCNKCISLEANIVKLNQMIYKYENGQFGLKNVLSNKRYTNDKSGLTYSKFDKPSSNKKIIFVKTINNKIQLKKVQDNFQTKKT